MRRYYFILYIDELGKTQYASYGSFESFLLDIEWMADTDSVVRYGVLKPALAQGRCESWVAIN